MNRNLGPEDYKNLLTRRCERLARLVKMKAPPTILAMEVQLVYRAAFIVMPTEMGRALNDDFVKLQRVNLGLCESEAKNMDNELYDPTKEH